MTPPPLGGPHLNALRELARDETLSQRDLASRLGVSLGRVNYIVRALVDRGLVKARRFKNSRHKLAYRYVLTPDGIAEKARVTSRFLRERLAEYERLRLEIEELRREAQGIDRATPTQPSPLEGEENGQPLSLEGRGQGEGGI